MKKRPRRLLCLVVTLGLVLIVCLLWRRPDEPVYNGKNVTYWIEHLVIVILSPDANGHSIAGSSRSLKALKALGPSAVPYLRTALRRGDSSWKPKYSSVWWHSPKWLRRLMPNPIDPQKFRRHLCAQVLGEIGPSAQEAIPDLIWVMENYKDIATLTAVVQALGAIAPGSTFEELVITALKKAKQNNSNTIAATIDLSLSKLEGPQTNKESPVDF